MSGNSRTHQILGIEGDLVPPRRHKLIIAVEDPAVHVLIPPRVKKGLEPTESGNRMHVSSVLKAQVFGGFITWLPSTLAPKLEAIINITRLALFFLFFQLAAVEEVVRSFTKVKVSIPQCENAQLQVEILHSNFN